LSPIEGKEPTAFDKAVGPLIGSCLRIVAFAVKNALDNAVLSWAGTDAFGVFGCTLGCCQEESKYEGEAKKDLK
jgi:hypothetical protein